MTELYTSKPLTIGGRLNKEVVGQVNNLINNKGIDYAAISLREDQERTNKEILKNKEREEKLAYEAKQTSSTDIASISAPDVVNAAEVARREANILELDKLEQSIKGEPLATDYANLIKRYQKEMRPAQIAHKQYCQAQDNAYNGLVREATASLDKNLAKQEVEFGKEFRPDQNASVSEAWAAAEKNDRNTTEYDISVYARERDIFKGKSEEKLGTFQGWIDKQTGMDQKVAIIARAIETAREKVDQDAGRQRSFEEQNVLLSIDYKNKFEGQVETSSNLSMSMDTRSEDNCVYYSQKEPSRFEKILIALTEQEECRKNGTKWEENIYKTGSRDTIRDEGNMIRVELSESYSNDNAIKSAAFLAMEKWQIVKPDVNSPLNFQLDMAKTCSEFPELNFKSGHKDVQRFYEDSCDLHTIEKRALGRPQEIEQITKEVEEVRRRSRERDLKLESDKRFEADVRVDFHKAKGLIAENPKMDWDSAKGQVEKERKEIRDELKKNNVPEVSPERQLTKSDEDFQYTQARMGVHVSKEQLDERAKEFKDFVGKTNCEPLPKLTDAELKEKYEKRSREVAAREKYDMEQKEKSRELN